MCLLVLSKLLNSITPAMRLWATTRLLGMVEMAIATGEVDKMRIGALVIASGLMGPGLRQFQLLL